MSEEPKYRDEQWLREQYVERRRSTLEIAEECDCTTTTVSDWLNRHGIETRGPAAQLPDQRLSDGDWLREQYVEKWQTTRDIAEECGCSKTTVRNWLNKHDIETGGCERQAPDKRLTDAEWLREQYVEQQRSAVNIAEQCGCSEATVHRWINRHDIEFAWYTHLAADKRLTNPDWVREQYVGQGLTCLEIAGECECDESTVVRWLNIHGIEARDYAPEPADQRLTDSEWLRERYIEQQRSMIDIAEECDCSTGTVGRWLDTHGIDTRPWPGGLVGSDHPLWNGGPILYGRGWNESKRQAVRERDNLTCQDPRCSVTQEEHLGDHGEKLHVHHLRKARDVDDPEERNAKENLITLCRDCHKRWEKIADTGLVPQVVQQSAD